MRRKIKNMKDSEVIIIKNREQGLAICKLLKKAGITNVGTLTKVMPEECELTKSDRQFYWNHEFSDKHIKYPASDFLPKKKKVTRKWVLKQIQKALEPTVHEKTVESLLRISGAVAEIPVTEPEVVSEKANELEKMEKNKWYKTPNLGKAMFFVTDIDWNNDEVKAYGLDCNGDWQDEDWNFADPHSKENEPATNEEVLEALTAEALKRGFKEGAKYHYPDKPHIEERFITGEFHYDYERLMNGVYVIMRDNGIWAEVIAEPEIDWSKPGQLVSNSDDSIIVMTSGDCNENVFFGTVIKEEQGVGFYQNYYKSAYTPFTGTITLSNN